MVQWEKAAAAKPENLSWSHMVGERRGPDPSSCPLTSTVADVHTCQNTHTLTHDCKKSAVYLL